MQRKQKQATLYVINFKTTLTVTRGLVKKIDLNKKLDLEDKRILGYIKDLEKKAS